MRAAKPERIHFINVNSYDSCPPWHQGPDSFLWLTSASLQLPYLKIRQISCTTRPNINQTAAQQILSFLLRSINEGGLTVDNSKVRIANSMSTLWTRRYVRPNICSATDILSLLSPYICVAVKSIIISCLLGGMIGRVMDSLRARINSKLYEKP